MDTKWSLPAVEVAIILGHARKFDDAMAAIELAVERYEVDSHMAFTHARILWLLNRFSEAVPQYRRVLTLNVQHAAAMQDLAHCFLMTGERREGRTLAKAAAHAGEPSILNDLGSGRYDT